MEYEFSIGSFFVGLLILAAGAALIKWYQPVADNFGAGVSSYSRYRLYGIIACGLGLVVMVNLHTLILRWFFGLLFPGSA